MNVIVKPADSFSAVGYNSKAVLSLPVGPTYHDIKLFTNLAPSQIKQVDVNLSNEGAIVQVTGEDLKLISRHLDRKEGQYVYVIPFVNVKAKSEAGSVFGGLVTLPGESLTLSVQTGDKLNAEAPAAQIEAHTTQAPAQAKRLWLPRIRSFTVPIGSIGKNQYTTYPANANSWIRRAYFVGGVDHLLLRRDTQVIHDASKVVQDDCLTGFGLKVEEGVYVFNPTRRGFEMADALNTGFNSEFVFELNTTSTETVNLLVESIETKADINSK